MSAPNSAVFGIVGVFLSSLAFLGFVDAAATVVKEEESTEPISYSTEVIYDDSMREGDIRVEQEGKDGEKKVKYSVTYKRGKEIKRTKLFEEVIEAVQNKVISKGTKVYYRCSNDVEYESLAEKNECEKRISWEKQKDARLQECYADSTKFDCWYDDYPGTTLHWSYWETIGSGGGGRIGAICRDGMYSSATGRGACSHHGGVRQWLYP